MTTMKDAAAQMSAEQADAFGSKDLEPVSAREVVNEMVAAGLLDEVMAKVATGQLALNGAGGFLPEMIKAALERGLAVELDEHLGYGRGDAAGRGSGNSRNGTTPKTMVRCPIPSGQGRPLRWQGPGKVGF